MELIDMRRPFALLALGLVLITACAQRPVTTSEAHLMAPVRPPLTLVSPPPLSPGLLTPAPVPLTYTLAVNQIDVRDFLFSLARQSGQNLDIHPAAQGRITLNAVNQTLPQILDRIAQQLDLRCTAENGVLRIQPDTPYLEHYPVDYVNMTRQMNATISANTQIASGPTGDARALAQSNSPAGNISNTRVENSTNNQFWQTLERNLQEILRETDQALPEGNSDTLTESDQQNASFGVRSPTGQTGSARNGRQNRAGVLSQPLPPPLPQAESNNTHLKQTSLVRTRTFREAATVIINPESGMVSVRATARQHRIVREFLHQALKAAQRQVLIEATIVEVELSEGYQQGIDWQRVSSDGQRSFALSQADVAGSPGNGLLPFRLMNKDNRGTLGVDLVIDLLRAFGQVKVLSSPRLVVLNAQTALLKVVENIVYFTVRADTVATANTGQTTTVTTTPQSVSVGLVMSVTPQISAQQEITLNVRPTISSVAKFVPDPNPVIPIPNQVPQIRTREIESVMRLQDGDIALLGGLMEDRLERHVGQTPGLSDIPLLGEFFTTRANQSRKTELVIFLRPVLPSLHTPTLTPPSPTFFHD